MPPTPFEHGLALAWSDGALSRDGAVMLETLQKQLGLTDSERAVVEESWLNDISRSTKRSFGDGDAILREWLEALNDRDALEPAARSMGKAALEIGLSKTTWIEAISFADGLGLGQELAEGAWLEVEAEELTEWPPALDPLAIILGLVITIPGTTNQKEETYSEGTTFVRINHPDAKSSHLSWMPDLLPIKDESCAWGWNDGVPNSEIPDSDLVYCNSVLQAWIRRLITMRRERGEEGISGLPEGCQVMPSSCELKRVGNELTISMIFDLGDAGLVRPWASVTIDNGATINEPPEGLAANWVSIHDALANLLVTGIETLPKQLLNASGIQMECSEANVDEGWIIHDLIAME